MDGKRILVVGASSGVGAAVARLADSRGARVVISARRADALTDMAKASTGMAAVPGDVRDEVSARGLVDSARGARRRSTPPSAGGWRPACSERVPAAPCP